MDKIVPKDNPGGGDFSNNETRSLWESTSSVGNSNNSNGNGFHSDMKESPLFPLALPKDNFSFGNSPLQQTYSSPTTSSGNFGSSPMHHGSYKSPGSNNFAESPFSMQTESFGSPLDNKSSPQSFSMTSQPHERLASDFASIGLHTPMTSQHTNGCSSSSNHLFTAPMSTTSPESLQRPNEKLIRSMSTGSKVFFVLLHLIKKILADRRVYEKYLKLVHFYKIYKFYNLTLFSFSIYFVMTTKETCSCIK